VSPVFWLLWLFGPVLQALLLHLLFTRGHWRQFRLLTVYCVILFATGILDAALLLDFGGWSDGGKLIYWVNDSLRQFFLLFLLIALTFQTLGHGPRVRRNQALILLAIVVIAGGSLIAYRTNDMRDVSRWFTPVIRNLSFGAALINLVLWCSSIRSRTASRLLLFLSCGIGIQMAGEAIGQSLRWIAHHNDRNLLLTTAGNLLLVASHIFCLFIWRHALLRVPNRTVAGPPFGGEVNARSVS
jgi:hypothetical protein